MIQTTGTYSFPYMFTSPLEGVQHAMDKMNQASKAVSQGDISPENMVSAMEAKIELKANMVMLRTADSMIGTLFDKKA